MKYDKPDRYSHARLVPNNILEFIFLITISNNIPIYNDYLYISFIGFFATLN